MKKVLSFIIALAMVIGAVPVMAEMPLGVVINGEKAGFETVWKDGVEYLPLRSFVEAIGGEVRWDHPNKSAVVNDGGVEIVVPIGQKWVQRAGLKQSLQTASIIINDLTYMPVEGLKVFNATYSEFDDGLSIEAAVFDGKILKISQNGKQLASVDGNLVMSEETGEEGMWKLTSRGEGSYRLQNVKTGKAIDVPSDSKDAGKTLILYAMTGGGNQNYVPVRSSDGKYLMQCYNSKLYMTVGEDGTITQEEKTEKDNQRFTLEIVSAGEISSVDAIPRDTEKDKYDGKYFVVDGEIYRVILKGDTYIVTDKEGKEAEVEFENAPLATLGDVSYGESDFVGGKYITLNIDGKKLGIENASKQSGGKIIASDLNDDSVNWEAVALGSDTFTLINKNSRLAIDVPNESKEAGIQLSQYTSNKKNHQVYSFEKAEGGVRLKNKNSDMYLTIKDGFAYQEEKADAGQVFTYEVTGESDTKMAAITATPFVLRGDSAVTNVKLQWNEVIGAKKYDIYRSENGGEYVLIERLTGYSVDDYLLTVGNKYTYRVYAADDNGLVGYAESEEFIPYEMPMDMKSTTNLEPSGMSTPGGGMRDKDGVYYRFSQTGRKDGGKGFGQVTMQTSEDGVTYTDPVIIMTVDDILAHESCKDIEDIRFESVNFKYNPKANNFGFIAHAEKGSGGYDFARISVATYTPGDEKMIFHGAVRPNGDDVRDLNTFIDDDGTGYIMGATHNNADLAIYRLKEDWSGVEKRIALLNQGLWRELPNVLKVDDTYYLFTSGCAGWYPTPGCYNSAKSMEGPWSELRNAGNLTTFSSQSGYGFYLKKDSTNYMMNSYRWMSYWKDATLKTTQSLRFPIKVSDGYAFYDYFEELLYNWDEDILAPVQRGRILSQNRPTSYGKNANDGNYKSQWSVDTAWPYEWEVDLGQSYNVNQVQISWRIHNGSEAYYQYKIEGSEDGVNYTTLVDKTEGYTDYGFTVDNCIGKARFVKVTVTNAKPRSGENNYPSSFYEIKVLGR